MIIKKKVDNGQFPVLFLITDLIPHAEGMGTEKTMYNLLTGYPKERLFIFATFADHPPNGLEGIIIREPLEYIIFNKWPRLYHYFKPTVTQINGWLRRWIPLKPWPKKSAIPDLILMATINKAHVVMAMRYSKEFNIPILPYFLDYWMVMSKLTLGGQDIHHIIRQILQKAKAWIVISQRLAEKLGALYGLEVPVTLVVHSPAIAVHPVLPAPPPGRLHIAYAGSLWDMHFDALQALSKALKLLGHHGIDAQLTVYTTEPQKRYRQKWFEESGTHYGGFLSPEPLMQALRQADMLLVTASFSSKQRHYSECSLQTKITEYMGSGIPILSIGPVYGECNRFFNHWNCGFTITTIEPGKIAEELSSISNQPTLIQQKSTNAVNLASTRFSQHEFQFQLFEMIKNFVQVSDK